MGKVFASEPEMAQWLGAKLRKSTAAYPLSREQFAAVGAAINMIYLHMIDPRGRPGTYTDNEASKAVLLAAETQVKASVSEFFKAFMRGFNSGEFPLDAQQAAQQAAQKLDG